MIQLLDWDLTRWRQPIVFNLELMKLSYYEKTHNNHIVTMVTKYDKEFDGRIYIRKDYEDFEYPTEIITNPNVVYGGNAISPTYEPLPPWVEQCPADISAYNGAVRFYKNSREQENAFHMMTNATHLRLSLDEKTIFPGFEYQLKNHNKSNYNIIIHDQNLKQISDFSDVIEYLIKRSRKGVRFGFKYPLELRSDTEILKWIELPKTLNFRNSIVTNPIDWTMFEKDEYPRQSITYNIDDSWGDGFEEIMMDCIFEAYYLAKKNISVNIKPKAGMKIGYCEQQLIALLNSQFETMVSYRDTFFFTPFIYCKYVYHYLPTYEKERVFREIKELYPDLFLLLYNIQYTVDRNGELEPHVLTKNELEEIGFYDKIRDKKESRKMQETFSGIIRPESVYLDR